MATNKGRAASKSAASGLACKHCGVKHRSLTEDECVDRKMSEKVLQNRVVSRARRLGWRVAHAGKGFAGSSEDGTGSFVTQMAKGWPDLFLLNEFRAPYRMAIELKREQGEIDDAQQEWLDLMNACGIPAMVIRPHHLRDGSVRAILVGT